jgi:hypothetical protein
LNAILANTIQRIFQPMSHTGHSAVTDHACHTLYGMCGPEHSLNDLTIRIFPLQTQ